jgi:hypothetical protein
VNKLIVAGALALGLVLTAQQEASAWTKFSFNAGVSINYEGGNNNFWGGLFRSGQVPGYPTDVYMGGPFAPVFGYPDCPVYGGVPYAYGYGGDAHGAPITTEPPTAPTPAKTNAQAIYYPNSGNQPASYYPSAGSYQYPAYGYGYGYTQQVPSYWYGR